MCKTRLLVNALEALHIYICKQYPEAIYFRVAHTANVIPESIFIGKVGSKILVRMEAAAIALREV